jgi:hypothetical protein
MADLDDSFDGLTGFAKLAAVAKDFDFGSNLPAATFPSAFVTSYAAIARGEPVDWDNNRIYFLAHFDDHVEICMYDGLFSPQRIQTQNRIIAESIYADPGATIMPPGFYAIGSAYGQVDEMRMMINLDPSAPEYGKIYVWYLAHDALGTGDNTRGLAHVADSLEAFFNGLQTEDAL